MNLYKDPVAYAKQMSIPEDLAKRWCEHILSLQEEIRQAKVCPVCKQSTLELQMGSYEENTGDYVYCEGTIQTTDDTGLPYEIDCEFEPQDITAQFVPLHDWYDYDHIMAIQVGDKTGPELFGADEWLSMVEKDINRAIKIKQEGKKLNE